MKEKRSLPIEGGCAFAFGILSLNKNGGCAIV